MQHYQKEVMAVASERRVVLGEEWTVEVARVYGSLLRSMSAVGRLLTTLSTRLT